MTRKFGLLIGAAALAALSGCDEGPSDRQNLLIVGSSTVYPFAVAVADAMEFGTTEEGVSLAPTIESTGTGEGIASFCAGVGLETPDIVNASRRMTREEYDTCAENGVTDIAEIRVGKDGIVFISSADEGLTMDLTKRTVYQALAAQPFGSSQQTENWSDVTGSFPEEPIIVYGPPETSGTLGSFLDLVFEPGCRADPGMSGFSETSERYTTMCRTLRDDGKFLEQSEQDDVTMRKVAQNPRSIGILGYSYFEENMDQVQALTLDGVAPSEETIVDGSYPASRPLYIYVKKAHLEQLPQLQDYVNQWTEMWGVDGALENMGLVHSDEETLAAQTEIARNLTSLNPDDLPSEGAEDGGDPVATEPEDAEA